MESRPVGPGMLGPLLRVDIGNAVLFCGDCLTIMPDIHGVSAVVTDPPYSSGGAFRSDRTAPTTQKYLGSDAGHNMEFSGDNRDQRSYTYWSTLWLGQALRAAKKGALAVVFTDWRQLPSTTDALQAGGWIWRGLVPWDKTEAVRPQLGRFRNQCEYVIWGSAGPMKIAGGVAPGLFRHRVLAAEKLHATGKPVPLMDDLLQLVEPGGLVLDPFMGSGSTAIACMRRGLRFIGIEIDRAIFDIACQRIRAAEQQPRLPIAPPAAEPTQTSIL